MITHNRVSIVLLGITFGVLLSFKPDVVLAHGFGDRYDLPVPLSFYIFGSAITVFLSFFIFGGFFGRNPEQTNHNRPHIKLSFTKNSQWYKLFFGSIQVLSVLGFILCILTGLFGSQTATDNLTPVIVWIVFWVGMYFASALLGNLWPLINPWSITFSWFYYILKRFTNHSSDTPKTKYPARWMFWPAVVFLVAFSWIEIIYPNSFVPRNLSFIILIYSIFTWAGMWCFGKNTWLKYGEVFGVTFSIISKLSPVQGENLNNGNSNTKLKLTVRPHGSGLLVHETVDLSKTFFVLVLLATVTFDGLTTTPIWEEILVFLASVSKDTILMNSVGYLMFIALFTSVYFGFCRLMILASGIKANPEKISGGFIYSLVPIAIAYHIAHYTSFILIQGQLIIPLLSDPFGFNWDIIGTRGYEVDIGIINARFIWYLSIVAIVVGHILAVFISHFRSVSLFGSSQAAMRSQLPMLILMVAYTMVSLWIISQPIIE